jgi:hypothetical protein
MKQRRDREPAYLPSAGYGYKRATRHKYVRHERQPAGKLIPQGSLIIYQCEETGAERAWGLE